MHFQLKFKFRTFVFIESLNVESCSLKDSKMTFWW
jgi:hypothetical protein